MTNHGADSFEVVGDDADEGNARMEVSFPKPSWLKRLLYHLPFATKQCPFGNVHLRWERFCACGVGVDVENDEGESVWHFGIYDFRRDMELQPCAHCHPAWGLVNHQWALTQEEEMLLGSWRKYRSSILDEYGESIPYEYAVSVKLNGAEQFLMSRTQGLAALQDTAPWMVRGAGEGGKPN